MATAYLRRMTVEERRLFCTKANGAIERQAKRAAIGAARADEDGDGGRPINDGLRASARR